MSRAEDLERSIRHIPELWRLRESLDKDTRKEFETFLNELFDNHDALFGADASPDFGPTELESFNTTARFLSKKYVEHPLWHTPWLTQYLLVDVLEGQCTALVWASDWGVYSEWSLRRSLSSPYRKFVPPLVSLAFFALCLWFLYWLVDTDCFIPAALLGTFMFYFYLIVKPWIWWRRRKNKTLSRRRASLLVNPLDEIRSSNYEPETISRRLQACEQKDLQVASIAFALLKLPTRTLQAPSVPSTP